MKEPSGRPLLRFERASLGYGKQPILTDVDLSVGAGSFLGIFGYNGSGKTTLLKTLLGLIPCVKGKLAYPRKRPRYGYVPQKEKLDPIYPLSAYDVAAMGTYRRWGWGSPRALVEACLADCGAAALAEKRYGDLSGGQRQRVLIARALCARPDLLVLDEPLAGIDIATQRSVLDLLARLKKQRRLTLMMVSHRIQAEKDLFTDIAWVDEGRVAVGAASEMLARGKLREAFRSELP